MALKGIETGIKDVEERHRFDEATLEAFLREHLPEVGTSFRVQQYRGGQSNPTYRLSDGKQAWVLRRKPPGNLVASAHAVDREYRVIRALNQTDFPVPRARVLCEDESVIGTAFYVMDEVPGRILFDQSLPDWSPGDRRAYYESQVSTLAKLHTIDHEAIGLGDYGKPGNYFARQIHVWSKQYKNADIPRSGSMERLIEWLPDNIPDEESTSIVHGDYALNNIMVHPTEPRIVAVLDWELSTIGHPFADLTYHIAQRHWPTSGFGKLSDDGLRERGIPTQDEYVARYCELTGRDAIPHLDFYLAFQHFRMAGIMFGIAARAKAGTAAGETAAETAKAAWPLADFALEQASKLGA